MKNLSILLFSFAFTALTTLAGAADVKLVTADMSHLYENYHRTAEARSRFESAVQSAEESTRAMMEEGQALIEEYQKLVEDAQSPALSGEARERAEAAANEKREEILQKEREVQQFQANTNQMLQQQRNNHRQLMLDEIREVVRSIADKRDANLVLDSSEDLQFGGMVIYADSSFDITEEVLKELNKDQK